MNRNDIKHGTAFLDMVWRYKFYLAFYTLLISSATFTILYAFGAVPDELRVLNTPPRPSEVQRVAGTTSALIASTTKARVANPAGNSNPVELPQRIIIEKIGIDAEVSNPASADNAILNSALLRGAVRYPGSGTLGHGNVFLFGHSTGIRIVNNQAYKTFNRLNYVSIGDVVRLQSADKEYRYKVTSVALVESGEELVDFSKNKNMLTLSTCNVFGEKQERFVVEAVYEKAVPLK